MVAGKGNGKIKAKARQVLEFAQERALMARDYVELHKALFDPKGKASLLFATESERGLFMRTSEYRKILTLFDGLPAPQAKGVVRHTEKVNGAR